MTVVEKFGYEGKRLSKLSTNNWIQEFSIPSLWGQQKDNFFSFKQIKNLQKVVETILSKCNGSLTNTQHTRLYTTKWQQTKSQRGHQKLMLYYKLSSLSGTKITQ